MGTDRLKVMQQRFNAGDDLGAVDAADVMERHEPGSPFPPWLRGRVYMRRPLYELAVAEFRLAVERDPHPAPRAMLAAALGRTGEIHEAVALIDEALTLDDSEEMAPEYAKIACGIVADATHGMSLMDKACFLNTLPDRVLDAATAGGWVKGR